MRTANPRSARRSLNPKLDENYYYLHINPDLIDHARVGNESPQPPQVPQRLGRPQMSLAPPGLATAPPLQRGPLARWQGCVGHRDLQRWFSGDGGWRSMKGPAREAAP